MSVYENKIIVIVIIQNELFFTNFGKSHFYFCTVQLFLHQQKCTNPIKVENDFNASAWF